MKTLLISVPRTARVVTSDISDQINTVWICLHGYGELAASFFENVSCLAGNKVLVVCPEALSRFYTRGGSGPVGASWMTKEIREVEIDDYCMYLDTLLKELLTRCTAVTSVNILGFSQGAATASRWFSRLSGVRVDNLVLWGAVFPPDMKAELKKGETHTYLFYGDEDKYLSKEEVERMRHQFERVIEYKGGHTVLPSVLREFFCDPDVFSI